MVLQRPDMQPRPLKTTQPRGQQGVDITPPAPAGPTRYVEPWYGEGAAETPRGRYKQGIAVQHFEDRQAAAADQPLPKPTNLPGHIKRAGRNVDTVLEPSSMSLRGAGELVKTLAGFAISGVELKLGIVDAIKNAASQFSANALIFAAFLVAPAVWSALRLLRSHHIFSKGNGEQNGNHSYIPRTSADDARLGRQRNFIVQQAKMQEDARQKQAELHQEALAALSAQNQEILDAGVRKEVITAAEQRGAANALAEEKLRQEALAAATQAGADQLRGAYQDLKDLPNKPAAQTTAASNGRIKGNQVVKRP